MVGGQAPRPLIGEHPSITAYKAERDANSWEAGIQPPPQPVFASKVYLQFEIPAEMEHYKGDIRRFVEAMLYKLEKNAHKGKWEDLSLEQAFKLLKEEVKELRAEIGGNSVKTVLEAADVANFALMIANIATERGK